VDWQIEPCPHQSQRSLSKVMPVVQIERIFIVIVFYTSEQAAIVVRFGVLFKWTS